MNIKLKDILWLMPKDEYVNIFFSGSIFGEGHVSGKVLAFRTYFPELVERHVDRLGTCDGDFAIYLVSAGEGVRP